MQQSLAKQEAEEMALSRRSSGVGGPELGKLEKSQRKLAERLDRVEKDISRKLDEIYRMAERKMMPGSGDSKRPKSGGDRPRSGSADSPASSEDGFFRDSAKENMFSARPSLNTTTNNAPRKVSFSEASSPGGRLSGISNANNSNGNSNGNSTATSPMLTHHKGPPRESPPVSLSGKKTGGNPFLRRVIALKQDDKDTSDISTSAPTATIPVVADGVLTATTMTTIAEARETSGGAQQETSASGLSKREEDKGEETSPLLSENDQKQSGNTDISLSTVSPSMLAFMDRKKAHDSLNSSVPSSPIAISGKKNLGNPARVQPSEKRGAGAADGVISDDAADLAVRAKPSSTST